MLAKTSRFLTMICSRSLLFFSLIMLFKSYVAWFGVFENGPSWAIMLKELPFILLIFCLIEWFATKRKLMVYTIFNLLLTAIFFAVIIYYKYYGVIVTYKALEQVNQVTAVSNSVFSLIDPQYLLIFTDVLIFGYLLIRNKSASSWKQAIRRPANKKLVASLFCISLLITSLNIYTNRGGFNEVVKAEKMGIFNYEAYTLLNQREPELIPSEEISQERINTLKGISTDPSAVPSLNGALKGKNLIIIQMESLQNFLVNLKIDGQEITPNLNKLVKDNTYFSHFYQQVGQGNTSDAEFVVNTSFYIPPEGAAVQNYVDKDLPSLPKLLKNEGYDTATFHTNVVEFWNRGELYSSLGFDKYYDKSFFGEEDKVFFGASDHVLYRKTAEKLEEMDQAENPFYAQIISMTAHHPFTLPEDKMTLSLPDRYDDTFVGDYIRAQHYADAELGNFIADLKERGIWDNSVIALYGDHLGLPTTSLDDKDLALLNEVLGHSYDYPDMINIPFVIASSGVTPTGEQKQIGGQVDILPTLSNLLGISLENHVHFGQDLLNEQNHNLLPERYYLPTGSFVNSSEVFISGSGYDDGEHHKLENIKETDHKTTEKDFYNALSLLDLSHSYISQLPLKK
ncbi:LTA synthase family protein [Paenibacillus sp. Marseille-Q4541]|uniref:LTA synthase family protein n=1 Tax=Paenibacillus sp. Marseille-Q4541 TaxID=2831522 RepID=UPI001BA67AD7|nr:LTA synthase family protein [Paenibacillus sp. Marseille-Q4541]